jgi:hypothetical protein
MIPVARARGLKFKGVPTAFSGMGLCDDRTVPRVSRLRPLLAHVFRPSAAQGFIVGPSPSLLQMNRFPRWNTCRGG